MDKSITQNDLSEEIVETSININMDDNGQEVNLVEEVDSNNSSELAEIRSINSMTPKMILMDQ